MFKKYIILFNFFLFCHISLGFAANANFHHFKSCQGANHQLQEIITTIQKLPEARQLFATIQREGPIQIIFDKDNDICREFGACWDPDHRVICVSTDSGRSKGDLIGSLLFELQNALVNSKIRYYDDLASKGNIGKEDYVRSIEYLEYQNSKKAAYIAERGIQQGLFPIQARLSTYDNFEEHYHYQKIGGHSACIARNYQNIVLQARSGFNY